MILKAHDCNSPHPTTLSSVVSHGSVHASAQTLRIAKQKSLSHARLVLLSPSHSFVTEFQGMWSSAGGKVCIRAVMIQGVLGWFFSSPPANKSTHRGTSSLAGSRAVTSLAVGLLFWLGGDGSELRLQLHCTLLFGTLELHQDFRW